LPAAGRRYAIFFFASADDPIMLYCAYSVKSTRFPLQSFAPRCPDASDGADSTGAALKIFNRLLFAAPVKYIYIEKPDTVRQGLRLIYYHYVTVTIKSIIEHNEQRT
jgi:hypothetical protein